VVFHSKQGGGRQVAPGAAQPGGWETPGWIGVKYGLIAWFVSTMLMTVVALVINQRGLLATMPKLSLVLAVVVGVLAMRKAKRANQALLSAAPANDARACAADEDSRR
jgi:membrane protein required for beta-lactamase induction